MLSSSNISKTKKTSKSKTPSFVCEVPLRVTDQQERILEARFAAARQAHGFSTYAIEKVADEMRRTTWLGEHLDSHVAQKLADRAFEAVQKVAFGNARKVRFKGKRGLHSLEGKTNAACIRWREDRVLWNGLELPMVESALRDSVIQHGLSSRIKYVRLVRRDLHGTDRYYSQLICEGTPYQKPEHVVATAQTDARAYESATV